MLQVGNWQLDELKLKRETKDHSAYHQAGLCFALMLNSDRLIGLMRGSTN